MTPATDSPVASRFIAGLGFRRGLCDERPMPPAAIVIHTTGSGPGARFLREGKRRGDGSPHDTAVRIYASIMQDSAHYVVGQAGECAQVVPEALSARHVGSSGSAVYARPRARWMTPGLAWWHERWPALESPYALAGGLLWRGGSCNRNSIGIEAVPPLAGARGPWSAECWRTLARLVLDIGERHGIPVDREHVVTHSDSHPASRSAKGAPWDPAPAAWSWERLRSAIASGA